MVVPKATMQGHAFPPLDPEVSKKEVKKAIPTPPVEVGTMASTVRTVVATMPSAVKAVVGKAPMVPTKCKPEAKAKGARSSSKSKS